MSVLVWVTVGLAFWHFTVFVPDHFRGGIVGALLGAVIGAVVVALIFHGFSIPSRDDTGIASFFEAIPGTLIGLVVVYFWGLQTERRDTTSI